MTKLNMQSFGSLDFWSEETSTYLTKVGQGWLGAPNTSSRKKSAHTAVSKGTGDDAGHLIARRFGGPDAECNFSRQNFLQNRGGGTYYDTEQMWAQALQAGSRVYVIVRARTLLGDDRTFYRGVEWTITTKGSRTTTGSVSFLNSESARMRAACGIIVPQHSDPAKIFSIFTGERIG